MIFNYFSVLGYAIGYRKSHTDNTKIIQLLMDNIFPLFNVNITDIHIFPSVFILQTIRFNYTSVHRYITYKNDDSFSFLDSGSGLR